MKLACFLITLVLLFINIISHAQNAAFITEGRIEFEKKFNLHSLYTGNDSWMEEIKKTIPQFKTTYFDLTFSGNKTLYQPGRDVPENARLWSLPAEENIHFCDFDSSMDIARKVVYEQTFLIKDSTRAIKWKITDETRNIAGFECRRANAVIMDSIYVVAFYTDAIITPGGPESFNGLPGMILGLALPHNHVTWFATKVYAEKINAATIKPPVKGKKTATAAYQSAIMEAMKNWGDYGKKSVFAAML
ncbi:GLPGLI family protein [Deminuibacter soli]|uniref:GLPGLI family protein n=1 Tax=Deminuibacter soli TaxID=2291815 RepID=A0A3E1NK63_9BACT|nr:GLPGLI family protein [Deminuibacter soli]